MIGKNKIETTAQTEDRYTYEDFLAEQSDGKQEEGFFSTAFDEFGESVSGFAGGLTTSIAHLPFNIGEGIGRLGGYITGADVDDESTLAGIMVKNAQHRKAQIDKFLSKGYDRFYEEGDEPGFSKALGEFTGDIYTGSKLIKGVNYLGSTLKSAPILKSLGIKGMQTLKSLKLAGVSEGILNNMANMGKAFGSRFPKLSQGLQKIALGAGIGAKDMSIFGIASKGEVTGADIGIGAGIGGGIPAIGQALRLAHNIPIIKQIPRVVNHFFGKQGGLTPDTMKIIEDNPQLMKKALLGEINFNNLIKEIKKLVPNKELTSVELRNIKKSLIIMGKQFGAQANANLANIRNTLPERIQEYKNAVEAVGKEFQNIPGANRAIKPDELKNFLALIDDLLPKFKSKGEEAGVGIIANQLTQIKNHIAKGGNVTYSDLIKIKQNITSEIDWTFMGNRMKNDLLIKYSKQVDDYILSISNSYKKISSRYAEIIKPFEKIEQKLVNKKYGEIIDLNEEKILGLLKDNNKLSVVAEALGTTPSVLRGQIEHTKDLLNISKSVTTISSAKYGQTLLDIANTDIKVASKLISKKLSQIKAITAKENLLAEELKPLAGIHRLSLSEGGELIANILGKQTQGALELKNFIIKKLGRGFYDKLMTMKSFKNIEKAITGQSAASKALNQKLAASAVGIKVPDSANFIMAQFLGEGNIAARILTEYSLWLKGSTSVSSKILSNIKKGKILSNKDYDFIFKAFIDTIVNSLQGDNK